MGAYTRTALRSLPCPAANRHARASGYLRVQTAAKNPSV